MATTEMNDREFYTDIIASLQEKIKKLKSQLKQAGSGKSEEPVMTSRRFDDRLYTGWIDGKVSIVLPVYNQAMFIKESIESVLLQTYPHFELIIVNDGSTDGIETVLNQYADHPKIKILTQPNQKLPVALNSGFRIATGEFYTWTSADNIMLPNQIEALVRFLRMNPEVAMVYSDFQIIDENGRPKQDPSFRPQNQDPGDRTIIRLPDTVTVENYHESGDNFVGPSFLYRQWVAHIIGEYSADTFGGEDYDYWLRINLLFQIRHLDKVLYRYRVHDKSLNAMAHKLNLFDNIRRVQERDKLRRQFYDNGLRVVGVGLECLEGLGDPDSDKTLFLFKLSHRTDRRVEHLMSTGQGVSVCVVDVEVDEYLLEDRIFSEADFIIATEPEDFEVMFPRHREKLLYLYAPSLHGDLFLKMAKSKLFRKLFESQGHCQSASIYQAPRKLNVALQVDPLDKGGLEQVVYDLAMHLDRSRFNVSVIVTDRCGMIGDRLKSKGIDVLEVKRSEDAYLSVLKERKIDVINTHYSSFGIERASSLPIGIVATIHSSYTWFTPADLEAMKRGDRLIDRYIAVSRQVKNHFRRKFHVPSRKIEVIPNGLNPEEFDQCDEVQYTRAALGYSEQDFILLNVGALNSFLKAHHLMLSAVKDLVKHYPAIRLLLVGHLYASEQDKQVYEAVVRRIETEGLSEFVRIMDSVERKHLKGLFRMSDVFLLPSIQEGCSMSLLEAIYFGLPVIASDVGSARDVIAQKDIGLIIANPYDDLVDLSLEEMLSISRSTKPENLEDLETAIVDLYQNRTLWAEKARKGSAKIRNEFDIDRMARRYEGQFVQTYYLFRKDDLRDVEVDDEKRGIKHDLQKQTHAQEEFIPLEKEFGTRHEKMREMHRKLNEAYAERLDSQKQLSIIQNQLCNVRSQLLSIESSLTWRIASRVLKMIQHTPLLREIANRMKEPVR